MRALHVAIKKMKILLFALLSIASISCSGVMFHREYSLDRKSSPKDVQTVSLVAHQNGFEDTDHKKWFKQKGLFDFLAMRIEGDGETLLFHSGLLPGPTLYFYPGPDRWKKEKENEVDHIISNLHGHGLNFKQVIPDYSRP